MPGTGLGTGQKGRKGTKLSLESLPPSHSSWGLGRSVELLGEGDCGPVPAEDAPYEDRHKGPRSPRSPGLELEGFFWIIETNYI